MATTQREVELIGGPLAGERVLIGTRDGRLPLWLLFVRPERPDFTVREAPPDATDLERVVAEYGRYNDNLYTFERIRPQGARWED